MPVNHFSHMSAVHDHLWQLLLFFLVSLLVFKVLFVSLTDDKQETCQLLHKQAIHYFICINTSTTGQNKELEHVLALSYEDQWRALRWQRTVDENNLAMSQWIIIVNLGDDSSDSDCSEDEMSGIRVSEVRMNVKVSQ